VNTSPLRVLKYFVEGFCKKLKYICFVNYLTLTLVMELNEKKTLKVCWLLKNESYTKTSLSEIIGISRPTLDKRIKSKKWKKGEIAIIDML